MMMVMRAMAVTAFSGTLRRRTVPARVSSMLTCVHTRDHISKRLEETRERLGNMLKSILLSIRMRPSSSPLELPRRILGGPEKLSECFICGFVVKQPILAAHGMVDNVADAFRQFRVRSESGLHGVQKVGNVVCE